MADENNSGAAADAAVTVSNEAVPAPKKTRKPRRSKAEISSGADTTASETTAKKARVKRGSKTAIATAPKSAVSKRTARVSAESSKPLTDAPTMESIDDIADLIKLEEENKSLRKQLSDKLRAENADLRKRLGQA